ncbi:DUF6090 family protein [Patiriisocius marinistellae]|nr:DUF6090 family protein [Patiriisocius marinistellae]
MFKNKIGRYLLYAIGEIVLVVIGILLALNINNNNEARKENNEYLRILNNIRFDLIKDTLSISKAIPYYESRATLAKRIVNDELSENDYKSCIFCASMLAFEFPILLNKKGSILLSNLNLSISQNDSLAFNILGFYKENEINFEPTRIEVGKNVMENIKHWRNNYPWFSKVISGKGDPKFIDYITNDPDFKNRVAYFKVMISDNYIKKLNDYNEQAKKLIEDIDDRLL